MNDLLMSGLSYIFGKRKRSDGDAPSDNDHASPSDPRSGVEPSGDTEEAEAPLPFKRLRVAAHPSAGCAGRPSALVEGNSEESGDSTEPKKGTVCQLPEEDAVRVLPLTSSKRKHRWGYQNGVAEGDKVDNGGSTEPKGAVCELPEKGTRTSSRRKQLWGYRDGSPSHTKDDSVGSGNSMAAAVDGAVCRLPEEGRRTSSRRKHRWGYLDGSPSRAEEHVANVESADATEAAVAGALCQLPEKGGVCALPVTSSRRKHRWGYLDGAPSHAEDEIVESGFSTEAAVVGAACQLPGRVCEHTSSRRKDRWGYLDGAPSHAEERVNKESAGVTKAAVDSTVCQLPEEGELPSTSSRRKGRWGYLDGSPSHAGVAGFPLNTSLLLGDAFGSFCAYGHAMHIESVLKERGNSAAVDSDSDVAEELPLTPHDEDGCEDNNESCASPPRISSDMEALGDALSDAVSFDKQHGDSAAAAAPVGALDHDCDPSLHHENGHVGREGLHYAKAVRKRLVWQKKDKKSSAGGDDPFTKSLHALSVAGEKALVNTYAQDGDFMKSLRALSKAGDKAAKTSSARAGVPFGSHLPRFGCSCHGESAMYEDPPIGFLPRPCPVPPFGFMSPLPKSLVFAPPSPPPSSSVSSLITSHMAPLAPPVLPVFPPLPVVSEPKVAARNGKRSRREVLPEKVKKRDEDKYLLEANITFTRLRCFYPPSERETAQSISKHLDTVVKAIQIISRQYNDQENPRSIPKAFWGLCRETDKVAGRIMRFPNKVADGRQKALVENSSFPVLGVTFSNDFNMQVTLPPGIKKVCYGHAYNMPTVLPRSVVDVTFGHEFNQPVILPPQLRKVLYGHMYNQPVDLPDSLRDVHFGYNFNQLVTLPRGLKRATFGNLFKQELGPLPPGLEEIGFKKWWNHDIHLPDTIRVCAFGQRFDKVITLGPNVEKFQLGSIQPLPEVLPQSLRVLSVCRKRFRSMRGIEDSLPIGCQIHRR